MSAEHPVYPGSELELFGDARNWKEYISSQVDQYLGRSVLEVGAGIGAATRALCKEKQTEWICLEPDPAFSEELTRQLEKKELPACCAVIKGTLSDLLPAASFESMLYMDVLEHISNDLDELNRAADFLSVGGHLVVLVPAHQWLFSPFDDAVGHYRRYTRQGLLGLKVDGLRPVLARYLDSVGLVASVANRFLLRSQVPTRTQIGIWDRIMVPASRVLDPIAGYSLGKSVLAVWEKQAVNTLEHQSASR